MNKNFRYNLVPQMKVYDSLGYEWLPFIMFNQTANFRSKEINTDNKGFRFNSYHQNFPKSIFEQKKDKQNVIILGSSYSFGVGSTSDVNTVVGNLEQINNNYNYFNLSGRAHVGLQEIISLLLNINEIQNVKRIIVLSGINDIHLSKFQDTTYPDLIYFKSLFESKMEESQLSYGKKIFKRMFDLFSSREISYEALKQINRSNLINFLSSSKFRKEKLNTKVRENISIEQKINRNIRLYKLLKDYYKCEIDFYFQPVNNWCKDRSIQEYQLQEYSNKYFSRINQHIDKTYNIDNYKKFTSLFHNLINKNGINFYDLNDHFRKNSSKKDWLFVDRVHCNDKGYKLAAELINK